VTEATKKSATAVVSVNGVMTVEDTGEDKVFTEPVCNIGVSAAATINTGNYNNVKLGVSLNVPCEHKEIDKVFEFAKEWVDKKMTVLTAQVNGA
jgi:hypothetical protein